MNNKSLKRNGIFTQLLIIKKRVPLQWRSLADTTVIMWSKWTSLAMGQIEIVTIWYTMRRTQHHFCDIPAKDVQSNHKEISEKFKLKDILQYNWPEICKSIIKVNKRLRNLSKETQQLNAVLDSESSPFDISGKTWMGSEDEWDSSNVNINFLILMIVLWLCGKMFLFIESTLWSICVWWVRSHQPHFFFKETFKWIFIGFPNLKDF